MRLPKESAIVLVVVTALAGCAQPKPTLVASREPWKEAPRLISGCLRPGQSEEAAAPLAEVKLRVVVSSLGEPSALSVVKSSGSKKQDDLVVDALRLCKFIPGTVDSVPSEAEYSYTYSWRVGQTLSGLMRCLAGDYPRASVELGEMGTAVMRLLRKTVDDEVEIRLARSTGYPRLDKAAIGFTRRCFAHPSVMADLPIGQPIQQSSTWMLSD